MSVVISTDPVAGNKAELVGYSHEPILSGFRAPDTVEHLFARSMNAKLRKWLDQTYDDEWDNACVVLSMKRRETPNIVAPRREVIDRVLVVTDPLSTVDIEIVETKLDFSIITGGVLSNGDVDSKVNCKQEKPSTLPDGVYELGTDWELTIPGDPKEVCRWTKLTD